MRKLFSGFFIDVYIAFWLLYTSALLCPLHHYCHHSSLQVSFPYSCLFVWDPLSLTKFVYMTWMWNFHWNLEGSAEGTQLKTIAVQSPCPEYISSWYFRTECSSKSLPYPWLAVLHAQCKQPQLLQDHDCTG